MRTLWLAALAAGMNLAVGAHALTLDEAIRRAADAQPILRAGAAAVSAARGARLQAGVRPNPSLTVEAENFLGTGPYGVLNQPEITGTYSQQLERGGKRQARIALADSDIAVAEAATAVERLDLAAQVQRAYLDVLVADEATKVALEALALARRLETEAKRRVASAKDPLFVGTNAAARVARARIGLEDAERRQVATRSALAAFWGETGEGLKPEGDALDLAASIGGGLAAADEQLAKAEQARADSAIAYEQSRRTQDYTLGGGLRYLRDTSDVAAVATVTIPLGRFDRNEGNIARARAERERVTLVAEAQRLQRQRTLSALRLEAGSAALRAKAWRQEIQPRTALALRQVQEGYARGGFSFRDLEAAADAVSEAQADYLAAIAQLRATQADIDRLTGRFSTVSDGGTPQ
jgi:cobalt-zinc-cadmium efflux system outer membrane protein